MDALLAAARVPAGDLDPVVAIVPTAAARQRPDVAVEHGERAFRSAAARAGIGVRLVTARILTRDDADDPSTSRRSRSRTSSTSPAAIPT